MTGDIASGKNGKQGRNCAWLIFVVLICVGAGLQNVGESSKFLKSIYEQGPSIIFAEEGNAMTLEDSSSPAHPSQPIEKVPLDEQQPRTAPPAVNPKPVEKSATFQAQESSSPGEISHIEENTEEHVAITKNDNPEPISNDQQSSTPGELSNNIEVQVEQDYVDTINDKGFDMIFWSETPMLAEGLTRSDFIVAGSYSKEKFPTLRNLKEVLRVDFRTCSNMTCPPLLSLNVSHVAAMKEFQRIKDKTFEIFSPTVHDRKNVINQKSLKAVTFWSQAEQDHVRFTYPSNLEVKSCRPSSACPKACPREPPEFPYMYDPIDRVCKSTHPDALPPNRAYGGYCWCESTCFTPEAVAYNTTWPWKNESERDFFDPYWNDLSKRRTLEVASNRNFQQRRTYPNSKYEAQFACNTTEIPPPIAGAFSHHLFFLPEAKLIFCGIPKVGITEWVKFLRYAIGARDYMSLPHFKPDREKLFVRSLELSRAEELFSDPSWTKAVFFRNPLERLASAFEDKVVRNGYTQKVFKIGDKQNQTTLSFEQFVEKITATDKLSECRDPTGLSACTDPHWMPQMMMCGLNHLLPKFNFIGSFDHIAEHTKILLEKTGIWDTLGRNFDDGKGARISPGSQICYSPPPLRSGNESIAGFNQRGVTRSGSYVHNTGSKDKMAKLYTPELMEKVEAAYALDFAVWNEISNRSATEIQDGKDLKVVRDYCKQYQDAVERAR